MIIIAVLGIIIMIIGLLLNINARKLSATKVDSQFGIRIVHISDLHFDTVLVNPAQIIKEICRQKPESHAGDEGPHLRDDGGVSGWFSSGGPRVRFLTGTTARSVSLSWGARVVGSPCEWRGLTHY